MKKLFVAALAALTAPAVMADITVRFDGVQPQPEYTFEYGYISDLVKPRQERPSSARDVAMVKDNSFFIRTLPDGSAQYMIMMPGRQYIPVYTSPGEDLTVTVTAESPLAYRVEGSQLMADIADLDTRATALSAKAAALMQNGGAAEDLAGLEKEYNKMFTDYIAANPKSQAVPYAVMMLSGQDFIDAYDAMTPEAAVSPLFPVAEAQRAYVERQMEAERRKVALESGNVEAPDFTFADMEGKNVSLSDFRGKWVIIDFWGSWCPWCIKGFPKLKEAYARYAPKLEVLGVACNDPRDAWEKAVRKYELPWVNVYNPGQGGGKVLEDYAVEGFPTKVIVNPEGKIVNITSGENPAFFDLLDKLLK